MIDEADRAAIALMAKTSECIAANDLAPSFERFAAIKILHHAIRHLAYPDRDVYPKVRGSKKSNPIFRHYDDGTRPL